MSEEVQVRRRRGFILASLLSLGALGAWVHHPSPKQACDHVHALAQRAGEPGDVATEAACEEQVALRFEGRGPFRGRTMLRCIMRADHLLAAAGC